MQNINPSYAMEIIEWQPEFSVNNLRIDEEHQNIIRITNNLILHSNAAVSSEIISETLTELIKYYKTHFKDEENFLEEKKYPKLEHHRELHNKFKYDVAMFSKDIIDRDKTVPVRMVKFMTEWILNHLTQEDMDYKKYLENPVG